jgi:PAS domain S-box-containing protein
MEEIMKLDILTLVVILSIANLLEVFALFFQYRVNRSFKGTGLWVLGFAVMAAGYTLIFLRGIISIKLITIITANSFILLGPIFIYIGLVRFLEKKENRRIILTLFAAFLLSFFYYTYVNDNIKLRTGIIYSAVSVVSFLTAKSLFSFKISSIRLSVYFNAALFIIQGCFFSIRALDALTFEPLNGIFTPTVMQMISFMFLFIIGIFLTFSLIIMVNQRMNAEMKEAKEHFELIFNTSPDAVLITRLSDGRFVNINNAFTGLTGFTTEDVSGKSSMEINLWENAESRNRFISVLLDKGFCQNMEAAFICKDGSRIDGLISAVIISIDGVKNIISVTRDITGRKRAEESLRESEMKYRSLIENTSDVVFCVNEKGEYQFTNKAFASTFEKTPDYFIGKTFWDVYPEEHADFRQAASKKVFESGETQSVEVTVPLPDRTLYFLAKANPIKDETGKVILNLTTATDITDRKRTEEALVAKSEELERYFSSSLDLLCIATTDGFFIRLNPEWESVLGYTIRDLEGRSFLDFVHPDDMDSTLAAMSKLDAQEKVQSFVNRYRGKDGSYRWIEWRSHPQGNLIYAAARDITKRKLAEDILRESEVKFRTVVETFPLAIHLSAGVEQKCEYLNPMFVKLFGYTIEEIPYAEQWFQLAYPDEKYRRQIQDEWKLRIKHAIDARTPIEPMEVTVTCRDGSRKNVLWGFITMGDKNYSWGLDLTDRKRAEEAVRESEEKLSTLFGSMTEMVVIHDLIFSEMGDAENYRITDCNNAFTEVTGIKREDAVGKPATEVYQIQPAPYLKEYSQVALTGIPYEYTTYYEPMDKHFSVSVVSPKKNSFATITTDITGIRQVQEVISAKNKELENYLFIASHDLRSPLVNIQGFSRRLQKQLDTITSVLSAYPLPPDIKTEIDAITEEGLPKTLDFIFSSVVKMDNLLNGLLQVSRTGRALMTMREIDVNHLIKMILGNYNYQLTELDAVVTIADLPPCYGDENLLNQLFSNIIGNAIKYRDKERQLVIDIAARLEFKKVIYSIKDNGTGIEPRHLEKIWDVFYRADSRQGDAGDGLGLSIVQRIAEKHNGKARVESEFGKGSIFHVELYRSEFS